MKKYRVSLIALALTAVMAIPVSSPDAAEMTNRLGIGLHGGIYKLGLSDHSDLWTLGWLANGDLKYGLSPKFALGVEGNLMRTYLADLTVGTRAADGAGLTTDKIDGGPRQSAFLIGLLGEYHFMPKKKLSPFFSLGTGLYSWKWTDNDGNTLMSDEPQLAGTGIPAGDLDAQRYELSDKELYVMGGLGLEYFPSTSVSIEVGTKFRYLTHIFSDFKDRQDIVGTDPGQLDLPKGIGELYAGLTFYFGGERKCPPLACRASASPMTGSPPLAVQFNGAVTGGCPPLAYNWDFGDGGSSNRLSPSHSYAALGSYKARLVVTDAKGNQSQDSIGAIAIACAPMTCTASADPASGTTPLDVTFSAAVTGGCPPHTYQWDFGDGGSSNEQNPRHRVENAGSFSASVTVTDSQGNTVKQEVAYGAEAAEFIPPPETPLVLKGVNFESNRAVLLDSSKLILDRVAASLAEHPDVRIEVGGHCDSQGADDYNLKLSTARANAVRNYMISKGIPPEQLVAVGYGEAHPIADNDSKEGRALNRRVEMKRID